MAKKFIPNGDGDFLAMARAFANAIAGEPARFHISQEDAAALSDAVARFGETFEALRAGGRSIVATATKEQARIGCEKLIRRVANQVRANESVDKFSRMKLGLRERPAKPKVLAVPNEAPQLLFVRALYEAGADRVEHELRFASMGGKPKPPGAVRLELFVDLIPPNEEIPTHPALTKTGRPMYLRSFTRSPIRLVPPLANVPMQVVYWARWADTAGNVGPFSETVMGCIEGGQHIAKLAALPNSRMQSFNVSFGEEVREPETVIVALLAAQERPAGRRALPSATQKQRQLEGPVEEAA